MPKEKWGRGVVRLLPSDRYAHMNCAFCKEDFTLDQGPQYDRHEYINKIHSDTVNCPLCMNTMGVPDEWIFGVVYN